MYLCSSSSMPFYLCCEFLILLHNGVLIRGGPRKFSLGGHYVKIKTLGEPPPGSASGLNFLLRPNVQEKCIDILIFLTYCLFFRTFIDSEDAI